MPVAREFLAGVDGIVHLLEGIDQLLEILTNLGEDSKENSVPTDLHHLVYHVVLSL